MPTSKLLEPGFRETVEREAVTLDISTIVEYLERQLSQKITAYLSGLDDVKMVGHWKSGRNEPRDLPKTRLRCAYKAARLLIEAYDAETAKAWFFGSNTLLDDEAPAYVLRYASTPDDLRLIIPAARRLVETAVPVQVPAEAR